MVLPDFKISYITIKHVNGFQFFSRLPISKYLILLLNMLPWLLLVFIYMNFKISYITIKRGIGGWAGRRDKISKYLILLLNSKQMGGCIISLYFKISYITIKRDTVPSVGMLNPKFQNILYYY